MITVTPQAAKQIRIASRESGVGNMALRLAAKKNPDGSLEYGMGFDETKDDDMVFTFDDVSVVIAPIYGPLLNGATLDYVELNPGEYQFIFLNPNDANYTSPEENAQNDSCGSGGCGGCGG